MLKLRVGLSRTGLAGTILPRHSKTALNFAQHVRFYSSPFPVNDKEIKQQRELKKLPKYKQWAAYLQSEKFNKSMTFYYIAGFMGLSIAWYYYMRDRYYEDQQIKHVKKKYQADPKLLSEYEYLMLKSLNREKLRPKEAKKYRIYQLMRKEFRRNNLLSGAMFNPSPEELDAWYASQPRMSSKKAPVLTDNDKDDVQDDTISNKDNPHIVPPEDTTEFYEQKAAEYDDSIKWEERGVFMGMRRRWLMKQVTGDVLEVACGTGRNIPYFSPELVKSITFLDSSRKMVNITQQKFRKSYPDFRNVAFTVGKAEDLVSLANDHVKYDTIVEAFGLCAHEDPVKALKNMASLLKPDGRIVLLEHGRSKWNFINNHLDFRSEKRMKTWACRWNLDIAELVDEAGLDITFEKRVHLSTTWMLILKKPEDSIKPSEKPFINKLMGSEPSTIRKE
jgi:methyltransferase OMS1